MGCNYVEGEVVSYLLSMILNMLIHVGFHSKDFRYLKNRPKTGVCICLSWKIIIRHIYDGIALWG